MTISRAFDAGVTREPRSGGGGAVRWRCVTTCSSTRAGVLQCFEEAATLPPSYYHRQVVTAWQNEGSAVDVPWRALGDMYDRRHWGLFSSVPVRKKMEEGGGRHTELVQQGRRPPRRRAEK
ncbi:unnamed protein product [Pylaiella littoralis]